MAKLWGIEFLSGSRYELSVETVDGVHVSLADW